MHSYQVAADPPRAEIMEDSELDVPVACNVRARGEASLVAGDERLEDVVPVILHEVHLRFNFEVLIGK